MKSLDSASPTPMDSEETRPSAFSPTRNNPSFGVKSASFDVVEENGPPTPIEDKPIGVSGLPALDITSVPLEFMENHHNGTAGEFVGVLPENEEHDELSEEEAKSIDDELENITYQISLAFSEGNRRTSLDNVQSPRHDDNPLASDMGTLIDIIGATPNGDWDNSEEVSSPSSSRNNESLSPLLDSGIESMKTEYSPKHLSYSDDSYNSLMPIHEECYREEVLPLNATHDMSSESFISNDNQSRTVTPDFDSDLSSRDLSTHNLDALSMPSNRNFRKSSSLSSLPCSPHRPRYRHWTPSPPPPSTRRTSWPQVAIDVNSLLEFAEEYSPTAHNDTLAPLQEDYEESGLRLRATTSDGEPVTSNGSPARALAPHYKKDMYQSKNRGLLEIIQEAIDSVQTLIMARVTVPFALAGICVMYRKVFCLCLVAVVVIIVYLYYRYYI